MRRGRPPEGSRQVERLSGPALGKERLRVLLATLSGELSLAEACERLELSETRLLQLRRRALAAAMAALARGPQGRPAQVPEAAPGRVAELEQEVKDLKRELLMEEVRTELALVLPRRVERAAAQAAKKKPRRRGRR